MENYHYRIVMTTPMGERHGTMCAAVDGDTLTGSLVLLGCSEPFTGSIGADGHCSITGILTTLLRKIKYTASGVITPRSVLLDLLGERNIFKITGRSEGGVSAE